MSDFEDGEPYYRRDLALVHHRGFGFHAEGCGPDLVELLAPVRARNGLVLEIGCGSGLLTRYLVDAGYRVLATDASPAMLELARDTTPGAEGFAQVRLPDDPVPACDAVVGIGHPLNYLPTREAIEQALVALARALRPGGVFATDLEDYEWATARADVHEQSRLGDDWAIITRYENPAPDRHVRDMTTFVRNDDDTWRRDHERHDNVLLDITSVPPLLTAEGLDVVLQRSFGAHELPVGLYALIARKPRVNDAIREAHDRAVAAGEPGYLDPETGYFVFTAAELLARGACCDSGCRHCPYAARN